MKIFLTGASGFIGKNFSKYAIRNGCFIYAPTRKRKKNKTKNFKWLKGDFDFNWKKELSDSDILVHLAASGLKENDCKDIYETNIFKSIKYPTRTMGKEKNKDKNNGINITAKGIND